MLVKFFGIVIGLIFIVGCKKEIPSHSLQYEVRVFSGNQSTFTIKYLDPSNATVSTGIIDTVFWQSALYNSVEEGRKYRIEITIEQGNPSFEILVRKNKSVIDELEVQKTQSEYIIEGEM